MQPVLIALLVVAALATLFVLAKGVIGMVQGSTTPERSQELMRKRVLFQGVAVLLAVVLLLIASNG
jgi:hypothetical protein